MGKIIGLMATIYDKDEQGNPTEEQHWLVESNRRQLIVKIKTHFVERRIRFDLLIRECNSINF
ncbi:hypothetical protein [Pleomorphochaeta sp. DL1XJH-081]|uniref:hypothetical protein n=1 Tax=Pleomorphochaeta sp. DL1XJH-081 TaxID=3409690 RepID=UPI003BB58C0B